MFYYRLVARNEPKANLYATKLGLELCKELKQQNIKVSRAILTDLLLVVVLSGCEVRCL
ncbi:4247_t:CDS:2 [Ambispora leptoticha]|uniref:4247_t:CDS:1 n=1 Tax=Ambispora leptoticha TaxID=144679 RepID=A0A9N9D8Q1_9GLOM|nr:4247_t:CDS:2 [Ambispora leptoticha]